jgi:hypothetical protein
MRKSRNQSLSWATCIHFINRRCGALEWSGGDARINIGCPRPANPANVTCYRGHDCRWANRNCRAFTKTSLAHSWASELMGSKTLAWKGIGMWRRSGIARESLGLCIVLTSMAVGRRTADLWMDAVPQSWSRHWSTWGSICKHRR